MTSTSSESGKERSSMDQSTINFILGGASALLGALAHIIWAAIRDLQKLQSRTERRVGEIEVLVAGDYLRKKEFEKFVDRVFIKLDSIDEKLDGKADK